MATNTSTKEKKKKEELPPGVGRVPKWWMEITPHYTLDMEEEHARRQAEDAMAVYYQYMAAAADAGMVGSDGKLLLGPDGKPLWTGSKGWSGRSGAGGGVSSTYYADGSGGRKFKAGECRIDPKLFGIDESDPDYQSYLTGAKLPPGFLEKMAELSAQEGIANNLHQTDFGRYGRQAEKPAFQPAWVKTKLKKTSHGESIRKGVYEDSPSKTIQKVKLRETLKERQTIQVAAPPLLDSEPQPPKEQMKSIAPPKLVEETVVVKEENGAKKLVRKVRRVVRRKKSTTNNAAAATSSPQAEQAPALIPVTKPESAPARAPIKEPEMVHKAPQYKFNDYYYNAPKAEQAPSAAPVKPKVTTAPVSAPPAAPVPPPTPQSIQTPLPVPIEDEPHYEHQQQQQYHQEQHEEIYDDEEEDYIEEEIIDDEDEELYEEEVYDDEDYGDDGYYEEEEETPTAVLANAELSDLQALLAAKQAELARLQKGF